MIDLMTDPSDRSPIEDGGNAPVRSAIRSGHRGGVDRQVMWWGLALAAGATTATGSPSLVPVLILILCSLVGLALNSSVGPSASLISSLPAGFVLVCAWALVWGLAGGLLGVDVWSRRAAALMGVATLVALTGFVVRRAPGRAVLAGADRASALGFGGLLALFGAITIWQPFQVLSRVTAAGTDFLRHLEMVRAVHAEGLLVPGEPGYPRALHALVSLCVGAMGWPTTAQNLWQAVVVLAFVMLAVILVGVMSTARWAASRIIPRPGVGSGAAWLAAFIFVQTAWFSVFLAQASLMNMVVGICLIALLSFGVQQGALGSLSGVLVGIGAVGVTANAWQLLCPVVAAGALPWVLPGIGRQLRRPAGLLVVTAGTMLVLNGALSLRGLDAPSATSIVTVSGLFRPDWWWGIALLLSLCAAVAVWRSGWARWSAVALGMLVAGLGLVAVLIFITGSSWDLLLYYPAKSLWTVLIIVVPLSAAGGTALMALVWSGCFGRGRHLVRAGLVLATVVIASGVLGRLASVPPHLLEIAGGSQNRVNWQLAVVDALDDGSVVSEPEDEVVVFGLVPSATTMQVAGGAVGAVDYLAMEAMDNLGFLNADGSEVKAGLAAHEPTAVCRFLQLHPDAHRITGPNPAAGAPWLIDSGCPEAVVRPEAWISAQLDEAWMAGTPWEGLHESGHSYPTFAEVEAATDHRGGALPAIHPGE